jgi:DNA polymerase type B, organellar and viral
LFRVYVLSFPTISSLAFGIFRSNFLLKDLKIPLNFKEISKDIKYSYTSVSVYVLKPYGEKFKVLMLIRLYPYILKFCKMPFATIKYFTGDISLIGDIPYGIFEVEVATPEYIRHPILQVKTITKKG